MEMMESNVDDRYITTRAIPRIGKAGQDKIQQTKVLIVGVGGLGSPIATYLVGQGVHTVGLIDNDVVMASNLHRQVLYSTEQIGRPKVECAKERLQGLNPHVNINTYDLRLNKDNADELIAEYDIILGATDNFLSKFALNEACYKAKKTYVVASVVEMFGEIYIFKPHTDSDLPCYQCVYPKSPAISEQVLSSEVGILGSAAGTMGTLMATETIKEIIGMQTASHYMITCDFATNFSTKVFLKKDPTCACCGGK